MNQQQQQELLTDQLGQTIKTTSFEALGNKYEGKVRDCYSREQADTMLLLATDRISCFDVVLSTVPFKGQILTALSVWWFDQTKHLCANHQIRQTDPNIVEVKKCNVIPVEVIVRGYLTGSAWREYQAGETKISGVQLPPGLRKSEKLAAPIVTPSTKAAIGDHDAPVSAAEIIENQVLSAQDWQFIEHTARVLYQFGVDRVKANGLILVDAKYEFGRTAGGQIILIDEVHTLDCARYWEADSYQQAFESGENPKMLDKENVRQWLIARGYQGQEGVEPPELPDSYRAEIAQLYLDAYQRITGEAFRPVGGDPIARISTLAGQG